MSIYKDQYRIVMCCKRYSNTEIEISFKILIYMVNSLFPSNFNANEVRILKCIAGICGCVRFLVFNKIEDPLTINLC